MRLIDAEKLYNEWFMTDGARLKIYTCDNFPVQVTINDVQKSIRNQPIIDAVPVVHAHWIYKERHLGSFKIVNGVSKNGDRVECLIDDRYTSKEPYCSKCGMRNDGLQLNYCPYCGAKMDEKGGAE